MSQNRGAKQILSRHYGASAMDTSNNGGLFGSPIASDFHYSEVSCEQDIVDFSHVEKIVVEPIEINGKQLATLAQEELNRIGSGIPVSARHYRSFFILPSLFIYQGSQRQMTKEVADNICLHLG